MVAHTFLLIMWMIFILDKVKKWIFPWFFYFQLCSQEQDLPFLIRSIQSAIHFTQVGWRRCRQVNMQKKIQHITFQNVPLIFECSSGFFRLLLCGCWLNLKQRNATTNWRRQGSLYPECLGTTLNWNSVCSTRYFTQIWNLRNRLPILWRHPCQYRIWEKVDNRIRFKVTLYTCSW